MNYETLSVSNPVARLFDTNAVRYAPLTSKDFDFEELSESEEIYLNNPTPENFIKWLSTSF